jgi:regulator of replication initiation timing
LLETKQVLETSERQCADLLTQVSSLRKQVEDRNRDVDILKASLADLEKRRLTLASENLSLGESNNRLREEVGSLRQRLYEMESRASVEALSIRPGGIRKQAEEAPQTRSPVPTRVDTLFSPTGAGSYGAQNFPSPASPVVVNRRHRPKSGKAPLPFADHQGVEPQSPKVVDPQHTVPVSSADQELPAFGARHRSVSPNPPWGLHDDIPAHWAREESVPEAEVAAVEAELLKLNLERTELESWLGRFPANYAGRTLAERKEKYMKEQRVSQITKLISDKKTLIKSWRQARSRPLG